VATRIARDVQKKENKKKKKKKKKKKEDKKKKKKKKDGHTTAMVPMEPIPLRCARAYQFKRSSWEPMVTGGHEAGIATRKLPLRCRGETTQTTSFDATVNPHLDNRRLRGHTVGLRPSGNLQELLCGTDGQLSPAAASGAAAGVSRYDVRAISRSSAFSICIVNGGQPETWADDGPVLPANDPSGRGRRARQTYFGPDGNPIVARAASSKNEWSGIHARLSCETSFFDEHKRPIMECRRLC